MKTTFVMLMGLVVNSFGAGFQSVNYTVLSDVADAGGVHSVSANYSNDGSMGGLGGVLTANSSQITDRVGYVGQLYEVTAFTLSAVTTNLNEGASMPLSAIQFLDDGTVSPANGFAKWTFAGPMVGVSSSGIVTAGTVDQNTLGVVEASLEGWSASLNLLVIYTGVSPAYNIIKGQLLSGSNVRLSFQGSYGTNYALDRCYNLSPPIIWVPQTTNSAGDGGLLIFTNLANPATNNFWRVRMIP